MKTISQNTERYSKQGANWVISASPAITPITLPIGVPLQNLKPVLKANGIIVKVDESYLCSITTLNEIKQSNNPHYDIVENGTLKVKDKSVVIGKTIKIIELKMDELDEIINGRDVLNKNAGVLDIIYCTETDELDGIPKGIIDQIDYTLDQDSQRPKDEYTFYDFYKMVDYSNNTDASHYKIAPLLVETQQADTIFDPNKLESYLREVADKLKKLEIDFDIIQDIFYDAKPPFIRPEFSEIKRATTDISQESSNHGTRRFKRSTGEFEDNALNQTKAEIETEQIELKTNIDEAQQSTQELRERTQEQLTQAQSGDAQTQAQIQKQLDDTIKQLIEVNLKLNL